MMRRGPLADTPIDVLLAAAASERASGVIELHGDVEALVYLVEGDVYLADLVGRPPLEAQLLEAGLLTPEQIERHTEPGDDGPYLALALDTDETIDEHSIGTWLFGLTTATLARFVGVTSGEYEVDPYGLHPSGILASWPPRDIFEHITSTGAADDGSPDDDGPDDASSVLPTDEADLGAPLFDSPDTGGASEVSSGPEPVLPGSSEPPGPEPVFPGSSEPSGPDPAGEVTPAADTTTRYTTIDTAPAGTDHVELNPVEWRIIVIAAQGTSLADLVARLELDETVVDRVVRTLCDRGLLTADR
ncbi:MAG: hypothetical protein JST73_06480 [Actinobacteria bacterium]|nr:hypothetical protein [Actinomycetota bacterium]